MQKQASPRPRRLLVVDEYQAGAGDAWRRQPRVSSALPGRRPPVPLSIAVETTTSPSIHWVATPVVIAQRSSSRLSFPVRLGARVTVLYHVVDFELRLLTRSPDLWCTHLRRNQARPRAWPDGTCSGSRYGGVGVDTGKATTDQPPRRGRGAQDEQVHGARNNPMIARPQSPSFDTFVSLSCLHATPPQLHL